MATFGRNLDCRELNSGCKGGKHFIQTSVGNFLSACAYSFLSLMFKKKKILCSLVQRYGFILISFFSS